MRLDDDALAFQASRAANSTPPNPVPMDEPLALPEDGEINGALLQRLREARGMTLRQLGEVTKVSVHYLKAIEANQFGDLPSRVYLRGFLIQYARALKVSSDRLAKGYLAFAERYHQPTR
jgi:hypothetical protein